MIAAFSFSDDPPPAAVFAPGGFHSFEHRWALDEAFRFHRAIGKSRVQARIHALNQQLREGLSKTPRVELHTPLSNELASGIVCFDVQGKTPGEVIARLGEKGVVGSVSPYRPSCARLAASLWNTPEQVELALRTVAELG